MKKTGKKIKRKKSLDSATVVKLDSTEISKTREELFAIEINDLKEKLHRKSCLAENLYQIMSQYKSKYEMEVKEKEDIYSHMKRTIDNLMSEIMYCQEKVIGFQNDCQLEKNILENKLIEVQTKHKQQLKELEEENLTLGGKLATLEEFENRKDNLYKQHEELQDKYSKEIELYQTKILQVQQESILECDRLKRELKANQEEHKNIQFSDEEVANTIKTTLTEMKELKNQLSNVSSLASKLSEEKEELKQSNFSLKQKFGTLDARERNLLSKVEVQQKLISILKNKCKKEKELSEDTKKLQEARRNLQEKGDEYKKQIEELKATNATLSSNLADINNKLEFSEKERKMHKDSNIQLIITMLHLSKVIKEAIMPEDETSAYSQKRHTLLHQLLQVLDCSSQLNNDYYLECLSSYGISSEQLHSWFSEGSLPKYKLGDLSFVPKREGIKSNSKDKISKIQEHSSNQEIQEKPKGVKTKQSAAVSKTDPLTAFEKLVKPLH